jgi:hypothetical protein
MKRIITPLSLAIRNYPEESSKPLKPLFNFIFASGICDPSHRDSTLASCRVESTVRCTHLLASYTFNRSKPKEKDMRQKNFSQIGSGPGTKILKTTRLNWEILFPTQKIILLNYFVVYHNWKVRLGKRSQNFFFSHPSSGGAKIPGAKSPRRLNFLRWCLIFVRPQNRNLFMSPYRRLELRRLLNFGRKIQAPRILKCLLDFGGKIQAPRILRCLLDSWEKIQVPRILRRLLDFGGKSQEPRILRCLLDFWRQIQAPRILRCLLDFLGKIQAPRILRCLLDFLGKIQAPRILRYLPDFWEKIKCAQPCPCKVIINNYHKSSRSYVTAYISYFQNVYQFVKHIAKISTIIYFSLCNFHPPVTTPWPSDCNVSSFKLNWEPHSPTQMTLSVGKLNSPTYVTVHLWHRSL